MDRSKWITDGIEDVPRTRPEHPFVVLDQNCMRDDRGVDHVTPLLEAARVGGPRVLVPDVALVEMTQHPLAWKGTMSRSFRLLAAELDAVVLGRSVAEMAREEISTGRPVTELVDGELVESLRDLIAELTSAEGPALAYFRERVTRARESAARDFYDHNRNKELAVDQNDGWRKVTSPAGAAALRAGDEQLLRLLALKAVKDFGVQALCRSGATRSVAESLLSTPSMCLAAVAAPVVSGLMWFADGGIDSRLPKDTSNDGIDLDYVRLAVFSAGVKSLDGRVRRLVEHVAAVMDMQVLDAVHGHADLVL